MREIQKFRWSNRGQGRFLTANITVCTAMTLWILALGGCDATLSSTPPADISAKSLGGEVLAFGGVRWILDGEKRTQDIVPHYLRIEDMQTGQLAVTEKGSFTWKLPRGTYILHQIYLGAPWSGAYRFTPKIAFELPGDAAAFCLGTLVLDAQGKRGIFGEVWIRDVRVRVEDDCARLTSEMQTRYTDPSLSYAKLLMIFDPRIPERPQELEDRDELREFVIEILRSIHVWQPLTY